MARAKGAAHSAIRDKLKFTRLKASPAPSQSTTIMAPAVNLLPPEILSEILQRVDHGPKVHLNQYVRFLSHVDRHWRFVALGTPQLWTTIVTKAPFDSVYDYDRVTVWIKRTKTLPITFVLRDIDKGAWGPLVDILKVIGPTVETIFLEPGHYCPLDRMLDGVSLSFPRLKYLRSNGTRSLLVVTKHFLAATPSIKQLSIASLERQGREKVGGTFSWITTLHLPALDGETVSALFANAKSLQHCSFATNASTMRIQRGQRHDALRSLFLHGYCEPTEDFGDVFPSFPNLEHLGLNLRTYDQTAGHPSLSRLFDACGATLRYLELCTSATSVAQFTHCLALAPHVRFLHLHGEVTEAFIRALIFHPEHNPILPELEILSLSGIWFTQDPLWKLAVSRTRVPDPGVDLQSHPSSSTSLSILSNIAAMHITNPPLRPSLWYITMSSFARSHELRSRFGWTKIRMRDDLGITLKIIGVKHHAPRKDAVELLGLSMNEAAQWDWKERDYIWKPTW